MVHHKTIPSHHWWEGMVLWCTIPSHHWLKLSRLKIQPVKMALYPAAQPSLPPPSPVRAGLSPVPATETSHSTGRGCVSCQESISGGSMSDQESISGCSSLTTSLYTHLGIAPQREGGYRGREKGQWTKPTNYLFYSYMEASQQCYLLLCPVPETLFPSSLYFI